MSILKAATFASKMIKEEQHTPFKSCRIAADYYNVSATDVQKELSSRGGSKAKGRKYKYVVSLRIPEKPIKLEENELEYYFVLEPKKTTKPQKVIEEDRNAHSEMISFVFNNSKEAWDFAKTKKEEMINNITVYKKEKRTMSDDWWFELMQEEE